MKAERRPKPISPYSETRHLDDSEDKLRLTHPQVWNSTTREEVKSDNFPVIKSQHSDKSSKSRYPKVQEGYMVKLPNVGTPAAKPPLPNSQKREQVLEHALTYQPELNYKMMRQYIVEC